MTFFKVLLATVLGFFISLLLVFVLLFGATVALIVSGTSTREVAVAEKSVLEIDLSDGVDEYRDVQGIQQVIRGGEGLSLRSLVQALEHAKTDKRIAAVHLKASGFDGGWAMAEEIRERLEALRSAGKYVLATSDANGFAEQEYFLASVADSVVMKPSARLEINGIGATLMFFKPALDKLGIQPEVSRVGKFKSAVEPFIRDSASPETQLMMREIVDGTFARFTGAVAASRRLPTAEIDAVASQRGVLTAYEALKAHLVDAVLYEDQIENSLKARTGRKADEKLRIVSAGDYASAIDNDGDDQIAIVYAVGEIVSGESEESVNPIFGGKKLGDETFGDAMETARESKSVKAVVVRIDSPGGEATASEEMWRQIHLTALNKPVIASMGATAASGGYYIASAANTIVADPTTLTGSIGVFGLWFNAKDFFNKTLGINTQVIASDSLADMMSPFRATTPLEMSIIQRSVDSTYARFLQVVAAGRHMTTERVNEIGQGRVYIGADAKKLGLVDELGGLGRSIEIAAAKAKLKAGTYGLRILPREKDLFESIMKMFNRRTEFALASPGALQETVAREMQRRCGVQMRGADIRIGD